MLRVEITSTAEQQVDIKHLFAALHHQVMWLLSVDTY